MLECLLFVFSFPAEINFKLNSFLRVRMNWFGGNTSGKKNLFSSSKTLQLPTGKKMNLFERKYILHYNVRRVVSIGFWGGLVVFGGSKAQFTWGFRMSCAWRASLALSS